MSVYTSLFISLCFNACGSLYSLISLILLNRVAWLVLLFEFSVSNSNGFGQSVRVKISTKTSETPPKTLEFYIDNPETGLKKTYINCYYFILAAVK